MQVVLVYLKPFRRNLLLNCVLQLKIAKKITENPYFESSRSFKVVDLDVNRKGVWDFLLVMNRTYLAPFLRYGDLLAQNDHFLYPLSFSVVDRGDPFRIWGKALRINQSVNQSIKIALVAKLL